MTTEDCTRCGSTTTPAGLIDVFLPLPGRDTVDGVPEERRRICRPCLEEVKEQNQERAAARTTHAVRGVAVR